MAGGYKYYPGNAGQLLYGPLSDALDQIIAQKERKAARGEEGRRFNARMQIERDKMAAAAQAERDRLLAEQARQEEAKQQAAAKHEIALAQAKGEIAPGMAGPSLSEAARLRGEKAPALLGAGALSPQLQSFAAALQGGQGGIDTALAAGPAVGLPGVSKGRGGGRYMEQFVNQLARGGEARLAGEEKQGWDLRKLGFEALPPDERLRAISHSLGVLKGGGPEQMVSELSEHIEPAGKERATIQQGKERLARSRGVTIVQPESFSKRLGPAIEAGNPEAARAAIRKVLPELSDDELDRTLNDWLAARDARVSADVENRRLNEEAEEIKAEIRTVKASVAQATAAYNRNAANLEKAKLPPLQARLKEIREALKPKARIPAGAKAPAAPAAAPAEAGLKAVLDKVNAYQKQGLSKKEAWARVKAEGYTLE